MSRNAKHFADRLNHCLDETGAPANVRERTVILSKMLDIPKHQAWTMLEGNLLPNEELLTTIATEFEVDPLWLSGNK
ncbi:MAG: hypothetical protein H0W64_04710 [Gammaproteobacteria bacterium]|nr:hypothetical protein [Gammaproteobacteria bacterium]